LLLTNSDTFPARFGRRWLLRFGKGRSALQGGFRTLSTTVVPDVDIEIPIGAHRSFWTGVSPDRDLIEFLARSLPENGLFLDIGANIGVYSAALWKIRGGMRGVAFEPIPSTQALLEQTFEYNHVPFVVERAAVSDKKGSLRLTAYAHGLNNFWIKDNDTSHPFSEVPTIPLDAWCGDDPTRIPGAIKIDVEGHELAVLKGGRRTFRTHRPALVMECHAAAWGDLGVSAEEVDDEIRSIGYKRLCDRQGRPVDFLQARDTFHLLALP
jgi:FkbM family methyltransferase